MAESLGRNYRDMATNFEMGAVGRTAKRGILGMGLGGVLGAGLAIFLTGGVAAPFIIGGIMVGGMAGAAWGSGSSDKAKAQNRPIRISDPLFGDQRKVYISEEQFKNIKAKIAQGVSYDEFNNDQLKAQFDAAEAPAAEK